VIKTSDLINVVHILELMRYKARAMEEEDTEEEDMEAEAAVPPVEMR
jgi:hypothetical protein